jgi:cytochrome c oxidase subunit 2
MKTVRVLAIAFLLSAGLWVAAAQDYGAPVIAQSSVQKIEMKARRYQFTPSTIRARAGVPVQLRVLSTDVVHGMAIPGLNINERLDPGKEVVINFTPAKAGSYPFFCSVYCGPGHANMKGELIVE